MSPDSLQNICQVAVIVFAFLVALASFGSNHFGKKAAIKKEQQLNKQIDELVKGKDELLSQNETLIRRVGEYKSDLEEKQKIINELETKAKKAERGIVDVYSFNGQRRLIRAGNINLVAGKEFEAFQQMKELEKSQKYNELIALCTQQIDEVPKWLTPYLFRGIALANLGNKDQAIADLKYVAENAPDDLEYAQAEKLLKQLNH
jgi:tetratricopeptide (TPR) repeat protein